jgi:hypothetical protein
MFLGKRSSHLPVPEQLRTSISASDWLRLQGACEIGFTEAHDDPATLAVASPLVMERS